MSLKIVGGIAKGFPLKGPKKEGIRPAASRVRKSIFDILGNLSGLQVLDVFAGTGSMGLEAISRGAAQATFVDKHLQAIGLLKENIQKTGFSQQSKIIQNDFLSAFDLLHRQKQQFDLIFFDPPYDKGFIQQGFEKMQRCAIFKEQAQIVCEHSPREIPPLISLLEKIDERQYGQTLVSFFQVR